MLRTSIQDRPLLMSMQLIWIIFLILKIVQMPRSQEKLSYKAPFVPFLPIAAIWFNVYLMLRLSKLTWLRFIIWCSIGMIIYFGYGITNSKLANNMKNKSKGRNAYENLEEDTDVGEQSSNQHQQQGQNVGQNIGHNTGQHQTGIDNPVYTDYNQNQSVNIQNNSNYLNNNCEDTQREYMADNSQNGFF